MSKHQLDVSSGQHAGRTARWLAIGRMNPITTTADDQRPEFDVITALHRENLVEVLGLQRARDQRQIHQRGHQREPGRALALRRVERDQGEQRHHAQLLERRGGRRIDQRDRARAEAERRLGPLMQAVDQPDVGQRQDRARDRDPEQDFGDGIFGDLLAEHPHRRDRDDRRRSAAARRRTRGRT